MYISPNTCPVCWRGQYTNGVCNSCHHTVTPKSQRRTDALPLFTVLKQRYVIGEVLGNGGFGITYSAWDNVQNQRVAIKELFPRKDVCREMDDVTVKVLEGQEDYFKILSTRFVNEAELLLELGKQCDIVSVYDLFHANGTVYYSMEFLDGCDLKTYLSKNGPMPWEVLEPKLLDLLRTLEKLHAKNLIHRDISPDNLFLTKDNKIRLIDFGSVRTYQGNQNFTVFLKQHFAPWEQYKSDSKQGPYTDIYSLSVSIYMVLTGKLPPKAPDRVSGAQVTPIRTLCPQVPDKVAKAIEKGMSLQAKDRFQNAGEFIRALGVQPPPPPQPKVVPQVPVSQSGTSNLAYWLHGRGGYYSGKRKRLMPNTEITIGRLSTNVVPYPDMTMGVSRNQCSIFISSTGDMYVRDNKSRYGTYLNDVPVSGNWTKVVSGSFLRFGNELFQLYLTSE